eukprot:7454806-Pyramimonas_sp.AAC.1
MVADLEGGRGLGYKQNGALFFRVEKSKSGPAWQKLQSRTPPASTLFEISPLPKLVEGKQIVQEISTQLGWKAEFVHIRSKGRGAKATPVVRCRAEGPPSVSDLTLAGVKATINIVKQKSATPAPSTTSWAEMITKYDKPEPKTTPATKKTSLAAQLTRPVPAPQQGQPVQHTPPPSDTPPSTPGSAMSPEFQKFLLEAIGKAVTANNQKIFAQLQLQGQ